MKSKLIVPGILLVLACLWGCNKEENIDEACQSQPMQVYIEYHSDTLFAIVPSHLSASADFAWQSGERSAFIIPKAPGNYTVTATDLRGCTAANTIKLGCSNGEFEVRDFDGNAYHVIESGGQCWCVENLRTRSTETGIPLRTTADWAEGPAYAKFDLGNDSTRTGLLYNRLAAQSKVCPSGWRVAQNSDWESLFQNLGGREVAALKLRNVNGWSNDLGNNASGFAALPTGRASQNGSAIIDVQDAFYWNQSANHAYHIPGGSSREVLRLEVLPDFQNNGFAIRCMKDASESAAAVNDSTPAIATIGVSDINYFTARLIGQLNNANGSPVTEFGFKWKESGVDVVFNSATASSLDADGSFSINLLGLKEATQYTFKAFAKNANGTGEGEALEFTTDEIDLTTFSVTDRSALATGPDRFIASFDVSSTDKSIEIESTGLLIGKSINPDLNEFTQKKSVQGTSFSDITFDQIVPKKEYMLQPFVVIQGVEKQLNSSTRFSFSTDSVHWSGADGEDWNTSTMDGITYPAVLLNNNLAWMSKNLESTSTAQGVTNVADFSPQVASYFVANIDEESSSILYNAYATNIDLICPAGWHIPSAAEVQNLLDWLMEIYDQQEDAVLASVRSANWANGSNESGLNANESRFITYGGANSPNEWNTLLRDDAILWWTSTSIGSGAAAISQSWFGMEANKLVYPKSQDRRSGGNIRCVRNR